MEDREDNDMHQKNRDGSPRPRRRRLIAGTAAASVLAAGAAFGAVTVLGGSGSLASASPTGQAALLNSALSAAAEPATPATPATVATDTAAAARHRLRDPLRRLRRLGGIDGQFTFETKAGPRTIAFERGTIQSVSGSDVVIKAKDGTTWTWALVSDSVIRQGGKKTTTSALSAGELVFAGGPVVSGTHDARLIVIGAPHKTSSGTSTGTSSSTSTT